MPYAIDRETGAPLRYDAEVKGGVVIFGARPGDPLTIISKTRLSYLRITRDRAEEVAYLERYYREEARRLGPPKLDRMRLIDGYFWNPVGDPRRRADH